MPTTIKLRNSVTTTSAPSSLVQGEVAINITDKKVWVGNAATTPIQLLGDGGSASFTSIAFGAGTVSSPSITFTGDTNTGIYSPAADTIAFTEGGVESMRIDSSGNVGIGTSSPSYPLQVSKGTTGAIAFMVNPAGLTNFAVIPSNSGTTGTQIGTTGGDTLAFITNNTERMRIDSSGNVGVGTSSPALTLTVQSNGGQIRVRNTTTRYRSDYSIDSSGNAEINAYDDTGAAYTQLTMHGNPLRFSTSGSERMRITSGGDVGIGTTTPDSKLNIQANTSAGTVAATPSIVLSNRSQTNATFLGGGIFADFYRDVSDPAYNAGIWFERIPASGNLSSDANIIFGSQANGTTGLPTERMRITSGGRLNIGTTGGSATRLEVEGGETMCFFINTSATDANYKTTMAFTDSNGSTRGTIRVNNSATQYNTSSDYRLKENIAPMASALSKIQALKPCTYTWKIDGHAGQGFIAHELAEIFPDAVAGEKDAVDDEGKPIYQGVDTSFLVATLTAAIQEQQAMIEELKQEVAKLKGV